MPAGKPRTRPKQVPTNSNGFVCEGHRRAILTLHLQETKWLQHPEAQ